MEEWQKDLIKMMESDIKMAQRDLDKYQSINLNGMVSYVQGRIDTLKNYIEYIKN
ncbi:hypothetical protein [Heyndrickxia camelliae]|uniref:hypothetical protein n=1 Tax=Heyndrickxia camelliae TaxID=1707093 RepID=UPI001A9C6A00|nr:hypothetical protein [Heyndrickxia camelliae]